MQKKKEGGLCAPGGALHGFPGPKCSICCLIFSVFGIVVLIAVGGFLEMPYRKIEGEDVLVDHEAQESSKNAYIAAAIYAAFVLGCAGRYILCLRTRKAVHDEDEDEY